MKEKRSVNSFEDLSIFKEYCQWEDSLLNSEFVFSRDIDDIFKILEEMQIGVDIIDEIFVSYGGFQTLIEEFENGELEFQEYPYIIQAFFDTKSMVGGRIVRALGTYCSTVKEEVKVIDVEEKEKFDSFYNDEILKPWICYKFKDMYWGVIIFDIIPEKKEIYLCKFF